MNNEKEKRLISQSIINKVEKFNGKVFSIIFLWFFQKNQ